MTNVDIRTEKNKEPSESKQGNDNIRTPTTLGPAPQEVKNITKKPKALLTSLNKLTANETGPNAAKRRILFEVAKSIICTFCKPRLAEDLESKQRKENTS